MEDTTVSTESTAVDSVSDGGAELRRRPLAIGQADGARPAAPPPRQVGKAASTTRFDRGSVGSRRRGLAVAGDSPFWTRVLEPRAFGHADV